MYVCVTSLVKTSVERYKKYWFLGLRNWKPLEIREAPPVENDEKNGILIKRQLIAEMIYVAKPIAHLISMGIFGNKTWKPWLISLSMDLIR